MKVSDLRVILGRSGESLRGYAARGMYRGRSCAAVISSEPSLDFFADVMVANQDRVRMVAWMMRNATTERFGSGWIIYWRDIPFTE